MAELQFSKASGFARKQDFHIYLCFGQSNMEGTAEIEMQDKFPDERFKVLQSLDCPNLSRNKLNWYTAIPPLCQCSSGLSLANSFGKMMVSSLSEDIIIGIINVAIGGCDIRLFDKDIYKDYLSAYTETWYTDRIEAYHSNPYNHLLTLAKAAQQDGTIKGILLHQGETNNGDAQWPIYVKKIYHDILEDLGLTPDSVPLLSGEVVHADQNGQCASMNHIIDQLPKTIPTAHIISSSGCSAQDDNVHFDSEGTRELGKRYAEKMLLLL